MEATLDVAEWLAAKGHDVVPHLSARMIRDRAHLVDVLARVRDAAVRRAFVVGGDGTAIGEFQDGLTLLRALVASMSGSPGVANEYGLGSLSAQQSPLSP
jgi:methylenetetrahydrofolate reductase (NADPH)